MRVNGPNVKMGDMIVIPTDEQAQDITHYLTGEDIESVLYQLSTHSSLSDIALYTEIPEHLHDLFFEMNLASPDDKSPGAIHSKTEKLPIGTKFLRPVIHDLSRELP
jgi:hypothetical protein